jgi:hypothetical protein
MGSGHRVAAKPHMPAPPYHQDHQHHQHRHLLSLACHVLVALTTIIASHTHQAHLLPAMHLLLLLVPPGGVTVTTTQPLAARQISLAHPPTAVLVGWLFQLPSPMALQPA